MRKRTNTTTKDEGVINLEETFEQNRQKVDVFGSGKEDHGAPQAVTIKMPQVQEVVQKILLSVDDTPHLRAEKIQAMADAARAHARLHELGVMNNQFLLLNEPKFIDPNAVRRGKKSGAGKIFWTMLLTAAVVAGIGVALYFTVL